MEICPRSKLPCPLAQIPSTLGSDQIPAARCFFRDAQNNRASSRPGFPVASFLFARRVVLDGISMHASHAQEMERQDLEQNDFLEYRAAVSMKSNQFIAQGPIMGNNGKP